MGVVRFVIGMFAVLPVLVCLVAAFSDAPLIGSLGEFAGSPEGTLASGAFSYYGLLFSLFAALEVKNLSDRYRFRLRSPEIRAKLASVCRQVQSFGAEPSEEIESQQFIHESVVALRAAERINNKDAKRVAAEARTALDGLLLQAKFHSKAGQTAGQLPGYWDYFQKISELTAELKSQLDDVRSL